jgi:hypothetical protein
MLPSSMRCSIPGLEALLAAALTAAAACASPAALRLDAPANGAPETAGERLRPEFGGWMLAPEAAAGSDVRVLADGSRLFILRGTRWIDHADGSAERSLQVFQEDDVKALELPAHLGGGYLFYVTSGAGTLIWRADTWTGDARPLARIDPPASEIVAGFDRLYLESATNYSLRAIDALTGKPVDLAPLPPAPAYGDMVFADAWTAVVLAGVRGALATFDAGESWHAVGTPAPATGLELLADGGVALGTERGRFELGPTGKLVALGARGEDAAFRGLSAFSSYAANAFAAGEPERSERPSSVLSLGRRPLRAAVLGGWPDTPETAVAIEEGVLGRVRLSDGKLLDAQPFAGKEPCRGVALGSGFGFVCGDARSDIEVYAYRNGGVQLAFRLDGPHAVRSSGNGALVISAPCSAVRRAAASPRAHAATSEAAPSGDHFCARQRSGELFDVSVRGEVEAERVAALRDGRVVVLNPPRSNAPGRISLVSRDGTSSKDLVLDPDTGPAARLVRSGLWLDELWELPSGELGAWVVGARAFVGVRIDLAGHVRIARLQEGVDETSFFGPDALHVAGAASLRETTDYGFEWRVSALPPAVLSPASPARSRWPARGCSAVGCGYDDWLRVGFSGERGVPEPVHPAVPERVSFDGARFAFWTLSCDAAPGDSAGPPQRASAAPVPRSDAAASPAERRPPGGVPESSAWLSFQGEPPPARSPASVGYDFGATNESGAYHAYVWGPNGGGWSRRGMWQARVGDRFSTAPPWSTAISRSPWPDPAAAAQAFGLDATTGVDWWFRPGDGGRLAAIQLRVRSDSMVHLLERDRAIVTLDLAKLPDLGVVTGAHAVGDRWYLGATRAERFHLYRIEGDEPVLVGSYPLLGRVTAQLVGSVQGDELGIWTRSSSSGWQVFPIDLRSFEAQPPISVRADALGNVPPPCERGRPGWMIIAGVPLTEASVSESNTHVEFTGSAEGLRTKRLTARVVMDDSGVCVDALAALVDGRSPGVLRLEHREPRRGSLALTVTDPVDERRWSFRCSP